MLRLQNVESHRSGARNKSRHQLRHEMKREVAAAAPDLLKMDQERLGRPSAFAILSLHKNEKYKYAENG